MSNVKTPSSNEIQITDFKSKYFVINTFVIHLKFAICHLAFGILMIPADKGFNSHSQL